MRDEIIPDSEEERLGVESLVLPSKTIELSFDEESDSSIEVLETRRAPTLKSKTFSSVKKKTIWRSHPSNINVDPLRFNLPVPVGEKDIRSPKSSKTLDFETLHTKDVIDLTTLTSESDDDADVFRIPTTETKGPVTSLGASEVSRRSSPELDGSSNKPQALDTRIARDDSILVLDEPRTARKPIRLQKLLDVGGAFEAAKTGNDDVFGIVRTPKRTKKTISPHDSPRPTASGSSHEAPPTPSRQKATTRTPGRLTKKAKEQAEQSRREAYAQQIFDELNETVFKGGIPESTKLKWSTRLLTTAGKAKWHRSREGIHTTEIELATKILDEDERIRNTLAHEMCHLACWIVSNQPSEAHGKIFKSWAAQVMRKRSDIEVTTRHTYEINYKYSWECMQCSKVYGRYSKSIRPDECLCGSCKTGKLRPLFEVRTPSKPKAKNGSNLNSVAPRDSPISLPPIVDLTLSDDEPTTPVQSVPNLLTEPPTTRRGGARGDGLDDAIKSLIEGMSQSTISTP